MSAWGPSGEAGRGSDPTIPLPVSDLPAGPPGRAGVPAGRPGWGAATGIAPPGHGHPPRGYRPAGSAPRRHRTRRLLRLVVVVILVLILCGALAFGGLLLATPSVGDARQLAQAQDRAHHAVYPGPAVPARFADSLIATEDHRFYSEPGIDLLAVGRVALSYVTGHGDQGGATLYQQLAKLLYTQGRSGVSVEAEQVALAVKLYLTYPRQEILRMYVDVAYFGNGFYGLAAASCGYFGLRPAGLSWPQAAMLAGLVQGPSLDDPLAHPANARAREVHVIGRLAATGKLTQAQANAALAVPLPRLLAQAGQHCSR